MVETHDEGAVRVVRFNRPEARNAFNGALYDATAEAIEEAASATGVHVVVLTGAGVAFSAGQDLKEMAAIVTGAAPPEAARGFPALLEVVQSFHKPLVAAVNGVGIGLGFTLLAHCDLVLISDDARLRVPFAELGVPAEAASSYLFPVTMGWQRAAHVLFTGAWLGAQEAVDAGIALARVPASSLMAETMALAGAIAAQPPDAVQAIKRLLLASRRDAVAAARGREDAAFAELLGSAANVEALDRFGDRHPA